MAVVALFLLAGALALLIAGWLTLLNWLHDPELPSVPWLKDAGPSCRVLFIYPHPDDETVAASGLMCELIKCGAAVQVVSATKGERGDELVKLQPGKLAALRTEEFGAVMTALGVKKFFLWDFPDGGLEQNKPELVDKLLKYLDTEEITHLVTYEPFGVYGHSDHVALTQAVLAVAQKSPKLVVTFSTISSHIAELADLPTHMSVVAGGKPQKPEYVFPAWRYFWRRRRALLNYKSQRVLRVSPKFLNHLGIAYEYYCTPEKHGRV